MLVRSNICLSWIVLIMVTNIACGGGGGDPECRAELTFTGGNFSEDAPFKGRGSGESESIAIENTCWDYCYRADTEFDAKYSVWLDSKAPESHIEANKDDRRKGKAMALSLDSELERHFMMCVNQCVDNVSAESGGFAATATCGSE